MQDLRPGADLESPSRREAGKRRERRSTSKVGHARHPVAKLGRAMGLLATLLIAGLAAAQGFSGSYVLPTDSGEITLQLQQQGGSVLGEMRLDGFTYQVEGEVDGVGLF